MKIEIDIDSREAEMILFALAMRSKQSKLSIGQASEAIATGNHLNGVFEHSFGWTPLDRMAHYRKPIKRVTITCYDLPPHD